MNTKIVGKYGAPQGDVPIVKVNSLADGALLTNNRIVAYGEQTGHHHQIVGGAQVYEVEREFYGQLFKGLDVVVSEGVDASLFHNSGGEHDTIVFTPGIWFIPTETQQVEYDGENERRVYD